MSEKREIKYKNSFLIYVFFILSFGIYAIVWQVKSKRDLNALGADIPTSWLLIVPFANIYWFYKWIDGYCHVKGDGNPVGYFLASIFFPPFQMVLPYLFQSEINKHAKQPDAQVEHAQAA